MRARVGTSGYAYDAWKGSFYPEKISASRMLAHYAERLDTVEINYTFRRIPKTHVVEGWAAQVPEGFDFVLKASQHLTHFKRLKRPESEEIVDLVAERTTVLGDRLGATLFQLPPNLQQDVARLDAFLDIVPAALRPVFEFRHPTWFDDATYDVLRRHDVPLVVADASEEEPPPVVATSRRGYLRLRRPEYDRAALERWAEVITAQPWDAVHVFFKHEDEGTGPRLAAELRALLP